MDLDRTDRIHIRKLHLRTIIGINPEERVKKQDVVISATLWADLRPAGESDDFAKTVDYKSLKNDIVVLVEESSFYLIEKMAEEIACLILSRTDVLACRITVDKPGALRFADSVAVEVFRKGRG